MDRAFVAAPLGQVNKVRWAAQFLQVLRGPFLSRREIWTVAVFSLGSV
jgi:hypothetical protein